MEINSRATVGGRRRKAWSDFSSQYQRKKRVANCKRCSNSSFIYRKRGFYACVELMNKDTGEVLSVEKDGRTRVGRGTQSESSTENLVDKTLYIKECFHVSNQTYHELAMVNKELPRTSALTKRARELDANYTVRPTPGTVVGVQQSLKEQLKKRIQILVKANPTLAKNAKNSSKSNWRRNTY